ncbi:MAG: methylamine dehydrogenase light chain [Myxococcota bacterium]
MTTLRGRVDRWVEGASRSLAKRTSRRGFLGRAATLLLGGATIPLLPVARGAAAEGASHGAAREPAPDESGLRGAQADPTSCDYWRHCAIDGFLCGCCGGSADRCPPGTEMSPITWIGTCRNPADGRDYVISYNDCCGKGYCGRCLCNRNEGDRPVYVAPKSNDINWCVGAASQAYHCSTARVLGVATER